MFCNEVRGLPHPRDRTPGNSFGTNHLIRSFAAKWIQRWADYYRLRNLSSQDQRRTAITRVLEPGLSYRQVQMKHRDPKTGLMK